MENSDLFENIQQGDTNAYKQLFMLYYDKLCHLACYYVKDPQQAEEIVEELFVHLWEKREQLFIQNLHVYLFTSVKNRSLTFLKKKHYHFLPIEDFNNALISENANPQHLIILEEQEKEVQHILSYLPEKKRLIFVLSRMDNLKYKEIADLLHISIRTVEDQIFKSVKILRKILTDRQQDLKR